MMIFDKAETLIAMLIFVSVTAAVMGIELFGAAASHRLTSNQVTVTKVADITEIKEVDKIALTEIIQTAPSNLVFELRPKNSNSSSESELPKYKVLSSLANSESIFKDNNTFSITADDGLVTIKAVS